MATADFTLTQTGYVDAGPAWVDLGAVTVIGLSAVGEAGARWTVAPKGVLATALNLRLVPASGGGLGDLAVFVVRENSCAPFSTASLPRNRRLATSALVSGITFAVGVPVDVVLPLNTATGQATDARQGIGFGADPNQLGLVLEWSGPDTVVTPTLTLTYQDAFTGLVWNDRVWARAAECPKCGRKSTRDTWVRDRYTGLMVCSKGCYDPMSLDDVDKKRPGRETGTGVGED